VAVVAARKGYAEILHSKSTSLVYTKNTIINPACKYIHAA
jgi:hypothetical protein